MTEEMKDWKLKLRYGKLRTQYKHFTALADGVVGELKDGFQCRPGRAWMAMKTWAQDADQSADMIKVIGGRLGFTVDSQVLIYDTEPEESPKEKPFGYGIGFTPYDGDAQQSPAGYVADRAEPEE